MVLSLVKSEAAFIVVSDKRCMHIAEDINTPRFTYCISKILVTVEKKELGQHITSDVSFLLLTFVCK